MGYTLIACRRILVKPLAWRGMNCEITAVLGGKANVEIIVDCEGARNQRALHVQLLWLRR